ncbi:hypothetical protein F5Y18DRAFT_405772 [Xylariaceae sp. FL1019]|nr:hypothetical protein F5Y18DRAFT_405772 [Xylariaceae sp. FL1019]
MRLEMKTSSAVFKWVTFEHSQVALRIGAKNHPARATAHGPLDSILVEMSATERAYLYSSWRAWNCLLKLVCLCPLCVTLLVQCLNGIVVREETYPMLRMYAVARRRLQRPLRVPFSDAPKPCPPRMGCHGSADTPPHDYHGPPCPHSALG